MISIKNLPDELAAEAEGIKKKESKKEKKV